LSNELESGSFRDPSGFLFRKDGILYRQINKSYKENFEKEFSKSFKINESITIPESDRILYHMEKIS